MLKKYSWFKSFMHGLIYISSKGRNLLCCWLTIILRKISILRKPFISVSYTWSPVADKRLHLHAYNHCSLGQIRNHILARGFSFRDYLHILFCHPLVRSQRESLSESRTYTFPGYPQNGIFSNKCL